MDISVVILTCNQRALTLRCLESIRELVTLSQFGHNQIILVDNGSTDGTLADVTASFPQVMTVALGENRGVAAGRNAGLAVASGRNLMILDNDTIASPATIKAMSDYLDTHSDVGLVSPRLISPQGEVQTSFKPYPGLGVKLRNVIMPRRSTSFAHEVPDLPFEPFYTIGAAQMFPRSVYAQAGPLDERIFFGPEDADFCMAVRGLGFRVVYDPSVTIVHDWQRATTRRLMSRGAMLHARALIHFWIKHRRLF